MSTLTQPIGLFDSGLGGLTVVKELIRALPHESFIYFGDTARLPYGNKNPAIERYALENTYCLVEKKIKALVIACHTASAFSLSTLRKTFEIPIIGMIEASVQKAIQTTRTGHIALLGTKGTVQSNIYPKSIQKLLPSAQVTSIACPLFVPLIEEQWIDHPTTRIIVREYLTPLRNKPIDTIILGCTHYNLLQKIIQEEVDANITLIDSASACAEHLSYFLQEYRLTAPSQSFVSHQYYTSEDPISFRLHAENIFGHSLSTVHFLSSETAAKASSLI
jgi:glutamate racemase